MNVEFPLVVRKSMYYDDVWLIDDANGKQINAGNRDLEVTEYIVAAVNACAAAGLTVEDLQNGMFFFKPYEASDESVTDTADQQALSAMVAPVFVLGDYVEAIVDIDDRMLYPNDPRFVNGALIYPKGSKGYVTYVGHGDELGLASYGLTIVVQFDDRATPLEMWQVDPRWFKKIVRS